LLADALHVRGRARATTGRLPAAREDALAANEEARRANYARLRASSADLLAALALDESDLDEALRWNTEARVYVQRPADQGLLLVSLITREAEIRAQRNDLAGARALVDQADEFVRTAELGDELTAIVEKTRGELAYGVGDFGEAIAHFEKARDSYARALGAWHYRIGHMWHQLASVYLEAGNYFEARRAYTQSIEIYDRTGDVPMPVRLGIELGLASCDDMLGDGEAALQRIEAARQLYRTAGFVDERMVGGIFQTEGVILMGLGRSNEALASLESALVHAEHQYGEGHVELRPMLANVALAARMAGRTELAEQYLQRALLIQSTIAEPDLQGAALLHAYGFLLLDRVQLDAAAEQFERAGTVIEAIAGIDSPDMGWVELGRGRIALARRDYPLARLSLERADALWSDDSIAPQDHAEVQRDLAVALWETGDRSRALALARTAAEVRPDDEILRAWLEAHTPK
jgi:tetratricopeptide (TPR) repeat protein